jgi:hypothetical protein
VGAFYVANQTGTATLTLTIGHGAGTVVFTVKVTVQ